MNPHGKQLKNDPLSSIVMSFLKKRKFSDVESSSGKSTDHVLLKVEDVALKTSVDIESGVPNVLSFSVNHLDPSNYDEQYGSLKSFISGANPAYRQELVKLLFPVFANSYLDLVAKGFLVNAQNFFSKYSCDLAAEFKEDIQNLQAITDSERLKSSDTAANFRRSKYVITLSHKVFTYFMQYLRSSEHLLLLQIINRNFAIEITQSKPGQKVGYNGSEEEKDDNVHVKTARETKHHKAVAEKEDLSLTALKESIEKVRNGPACSPSVCLYTFHNAYQGLSSAGISNDGGILCGGFEDSSVHLWSLTPKKLVRPKTKTADVSKITLAPDTLPSDSSRVETKSVEDLPLLGHSGPVYATCFSPDGSIVLSASEDTTVRLWSLHSYSNVVLYKGHNYPVWSLDISPQSHYFVSGSHDSTARLWNVEYNYPLRILAGHLQDVDSVKFHPNCNYLATGSTDKTCRLWDVQAGNCVRLFRGHKGSVLSLAISPDGKYLVSSGEDRRIRVWDLSAGNLLKELRGHTDTVYSLCFSADGTLLASGGMDSHVRVWDFSQVSKAAPSSSSSNTAVQSSELLASYSTRNASVHCVKFSSCNLVLAAGAIMN